MAIIDPPNSKGLIDLCPSEVIDPDIAADIAKFEVMLSQYLADDLDEDVFRVFRLTNGIYGQRQGGRNQMIRVRMPYGAITADQLDMLGFVAKHYSRQWLSLIHI